MWLWFGYFDKAVATSTCLLLFLGSVVICAFPAAFITAGGCCGTEWDQKICCFCTNSDVIGTASQTVWTGGTACNRCVWGGEWWVFHQQFCIRKWQEVTLFWYLISDFCISPFSTLLWRDITLQILTQFCIKKQLGSQSDTWGVVFCVNASVNGAVLK